MMKKVKCTFLMSALMFSSWGLANDKANKLSLYQTEIKLGEQTSPNYFGPLDARTRYQEHLGQTQFLDLIFEKNYLNNNFESQAIDLNSFWFDKLVNQSTCPNEELGENIEYIRYLYRLVTMSYLFEGLRLNHVASKQLGGGACSIKFKDIFETCSPQTNDMKMFKGRVAGKFANDIEKNIISRFTQKEMKEWLDRFHASNSLTTDPLFSRLHQWCRDNKKNCKRITQEELLSVLGSQCEADTKKIGLICSEKDSYFGLSSIPLATELVKKSNAFKIINKAGYGEECLSRYQKLSKYKEVKDSDLDHNFPLLYSHLLKSNSRYLQGELFLPGALKEFDMKGLSDFLTALKPPKKEEAIVVPEPVKVGPVVEVKPVVVEVKKEEVVIEEPAPVVVKISEFEQGISDLHNNSALARVIDMEKFKNDFVFTDEMVAGLAGPIKNFQTRTALQDMKSYDNLGSLDAPVGLVFIKYLIDTNNHQGLYNILSVLGDKFFVVNDIEQKNRAQLITLKNDSTTKNKWQIVLLKK